MKRYILTGTPGSGKTSILNVLSDRGYQVIHEAATDVIAAEQAKGNAEPWIKPTFIEKIIKLQHERQNQLDTSDSKLQFFDRSPVCTYALAVYLGYQPSLALMEEIYRVKTLYANRVFFIENLGFCESTAARKISFEDALKFEKIHEEAYEKFGYECFRIPALSLHERVQLILTLI